MNINDEIELLRGMSLPRLKERFHEVYGEPTRSNHKEHLVRRVAWRLQALREGDLTERARRRARELANDADLRLNPPKVQAPAAPAAVPPARTETARLPVARSDRLPMPGALLRREYKGKTIAVRVLDRGFEFDGEVYRSLSAVAKAATGSHWNGFHFFGLDRQPEARP